MSASAFDLLLDGEMRKISVDVRDGVLVVNEGGRVFEAAVRRVSGNELKLRLGNRSFKVFLARDGERTFVAVDGRQFVVSEPRAEDGRPSAADDKAAVQTALDSGIVSGPYAPQVKALEEEWARYCGVRHALMTNSGSLV